MKRRNTPGRYIRRTFEVVLRKALREFPVVILEGPRQSGKTTTLRHLFGGSHHYVSLDLPDVKAAAEADPRGFLAAHPRPAILDEVQNAPALLSYVKERVDADRNRPGQYILTGSQNLGLTQSVSETLAGRAAVLRLLPLSAREAAGDPLRPLPWERRRQSLTNVRSGTEVWKRLLRGGYPELVAHPKRDAALWQGSFVQTYLERDVRSLRNVGSLSEFRRFLQAVAARSAQLLNLTELARDLGLAVNTAKAWLSVLEATYQVLLLRPYFANIGKRLVKTPKVYMTDVGTLCYLVGLASPEHARRGPMGGAIMETAVVIEIFRTLTHGGVQPRLFFWGPSAGREVDLLIEAGEKLVPVEAKLSATPRPEMAGGIRRLRQDLGPRVEKGYVVYLGEARLPLGPDASAIPFAEL